MLYKIQQSLETLSRIRRASPSTGKMLSSTASRSWSNLASGAPFGLHFKVFQHLVGRPCHMGTEAWRAIFLTGSLTLLIICRLRDTFRGTTKSCPRGPQTVLEVAMADSAGTSPRRRQFKQVLSQVTFTWNRTRLVTGIFSRTRNLSLLRNLLVSEPVGWNANGTDAHGLTLLLSLWYLGVLAAQDVSNANGDQWDLIWLCISLLTVQGGLQRCNGMQSHFVGLIYGGAPHDCVRRHGVIRDVFFLLLGNHFTYKVLR